MDLWSVTLYTDWYSYPDIICYKYFVNPDSAKHQAIRPERMLGAVSCHYLLKYPGTVGRATSKVASSGIVPALGVTLSQINNF